LVFVMMSTRNSGEPYLLTPHFKCNLQDQALNISLSDIFYLLPFYFGVITFSLKVLSLANTLSLESHKTH
jgi:hypothetical protein